MKRNKFALVVAYTCNENIKRDVKKLLANVNLTKASITYSLCPISNASQYFDTCIKELLPKAYSVYLLLFALNMIGEVMFLELYKPIDENIEVKVTDRIAKFNLY